MGARLDSDRPTWPEAAGSTRPRPTVAGSCPGVLGPEPGQEPRHAIPPAHERDGAAPGRPRLAEREEELQAGSIDVQAGREVHLHAKRLAGQLEQEPVQRRGLEDVHVPAQDQPHGAFGALYLLGHQAIPASSSDARSILASGSTWSAAPSAIASRGIPNTTHDASSWAMVRAPVRFISRRPRAPSAPIPVKMIPIASGPAASATDWKSTSTDGRCRLTGGFWSIRTM